MSLSINERKKNALLASTDFIKKTVAAISSIKQYTHTSHSLRLSPYVPHTTL